MATNPYAPPRAMVRDVADPSVRNEPADRGIRLGAALLDSVIFTVMVYIPMIGAAVAAAAFEGATAAASADGATADDSAAMVLGVVGMVALIGFVVWLWLTLRFMNRNGQSIAKKMLGIKVVRTDGSRASLARLFWLRNIVNGLLNFVPVYGLVDSLFIFGEERKCIHDMIADTIVVKA